MITDNDTRLKNLKSWLTQYADKPQTLRIEPASEDASFRRYFRIWMDNNTYIAMDAPPEHEDCNPFIAIATLLEKHHLHVPHIFQYDLNLGFLLISDLGSTHYLAKLDASCADQLYSDALDALFIMQTQVPHAELPAYNHHLLNQEMSLFLEWFLHRHLKIKLKQHDEKLINSTFERLSESALEQPQVFVHRDYHSRNLMISSNHNPGIIDFQDAVSGPITYDMVSLLKDAYISWPTEQINNWVANYYQRLRTNEIINVEKNQFQRWFDWMGLQRHLKVAGIFSRLHYRDNKPQYLNDIPRTMTYVFNICQEYAELDEFNQLLKRLLIKEQLQA